MSETQTELTPVELYFDFISPFAYLAWQRVHEVVEGHGRELILRPVLFAALLDHWGQLGPAEIAPKRVYIFKQVLRRAHALGVPLAPPPRHPFNPLLSLRLAALPLEAGQRRELVDVLFRATWAGGPGVDDPDVVAGLLRDAGFDADALLAAATATDHKQALIAATQTALERGVFGVPTLLVGDELFWGEDSLDDLAAYLRGEDPVDREALARWAELPVGAQRPGSRDRTP